MTRDILRANSDSFGLVQVPVKKLLTFLSCILLSSFLTVLTVSSASPSKNPYQETRTDKPLTTKAVVKSKPEPHCPQEANEQKIRATIVLRAIFSSTSEVTNIKFADVRPSDVPEDIVKGLSEKSIRAASKIKFKPATKDGKPVSMYIQLEYNFNCY